MKTSVGGMRVMAMAALWILVGCVQAPPPGLTDASQQAPTPQQVKDRARQAALDREILERAAVHRDREALRQAQERVRIANLYDTAEYGDIVECSLSGGLIRFPPGWEHYRKIFFTLVPGETRRVQVTAVRASGGRDLWAGMDAQRSALQLCDQDPRSVIHASCAIVSGIWADMTDGIKRPVSLKDQASGLSLQCGYRPTDASEHGPGGSRSGSRRR